MLWKKRQVVVEIIILVITFILINRRALVFHELYPSMDFQFYYGSVWIDVFLWLSLLALCFWILFRENHIGDYFRRWIKNWPLIIFIGYSIISLSWSIYFTASLYRVLLLFFSSVIAAYLGVRYTSRQFLDILTWLGAVIVILNLLMVAFLPSMGTMPGYPYFGAWRGIFWHRNHMGSLEAMFNLVFLLGLVSGELSKKLRMLFNVVFYFLTLLLVVLSRSATGVILLVILNFVLLAVFAWLKWGARLRPPHYYALVGFVSIAFVIVLFNLDFLLGLLGRNTTLTGRVYLWEYLIEKVISLRPVFGYGFGAIWNIDSFRVNTAVTIGWSFPVLIADNGYLDILLNLGIVGLLSFLAVIILTCVRVFKSAITQHSFISSFPLLIMAYVLLANISFSLFLEFEEFIWVLVITILFLSTLDKSDSLKPK